MLIFRQATKFIIVGALNTVIDFGLLSVLMWTTGIFAGPLYSLFKGISFIAGTINSYVFNKFWTFRKNDTKEVKKEFAKFFAVASGGLVVNVGIASVVVNSVGPQFGLPQEFWAYAGALCAVLIVMIWNFLGYKFLVFRK